jgi:hypothetical protein
VLTSPKRARNDRCPRPRSTAGDDRSPDIGRGLDNSLGSIRLTRVDNAAIKLNGSPLTVGSTVMLPANTAQIVLVISRRAPAQESNQANTVAFTVMDVCGEWRSFVGGGSGAF